MRIRPVAADDHDAWRPLWDAYNAFYGRVGPTALDAEITATTWARFLDPDEPVHALVAERDGTVVGLAHYLFHRSTIQLGPACYLQDLFTRPAERGSGVGAGLIDAVWARAQESGCPRLYWQTHETNTTAMRLYDRIATRTGFLVYARA